MFSPETHMYALANFTSVFEVATALCLGYGLLKSIYEFPLATIENQLKNARGTLIEFGEDHPSSGLEPIIGLVERTYSVKKPELERLYTLLARISVGLSTLPISLLIFAGFYNDPLPVICVAGLLFTTLLIAPALAFIAWRKSQNILRPIRPQLTLLTMETLEVLLASQSIATSDKQQLHEKKYGQQ